MYTTNDYQSNRLYIDNIEIGEDSILKAQMQEEQVSHARLSTYPNPYDPDFGLSVKLENLKNQKVKVQLINILGEEIANLYQGLILYNDHIINNVNLSNIERGIYFISVSVNNNTVLTDKFILDR